MHIFVCQSIFFVLALSVVSPVLYSQWRSPDTTWLYKTVDEIELSLHVYLPKDYSNIDNRAAIIFFFGGAWNNGSPGQHYGQCAYLADRGMVAMSAEYRVKSRNQTTPKECVKDGKSAIRWLRARAKKYGIDPTRIAAGGASAGGHVAAATATITGLEEAGEDLVVSSRPNALVLFNPVFDNGPGGFGYDRMRTYWEDISPLHNIDASAPPTVIFLGTEDQYISVSSARRYRKRMQFVGQRCDLHLYGGQEHGFFNPDRNNGYFENTLQKAEAFLISLGYLDI